MDGHAVGQLNLQATASAAAAPSTAPTAALTLAPRVGASQREKPPHGETLAPHREGSE